MQHFLTAHVYITKDCELLNACLIQAVLIYLLQASIATVDQTAQHPPKHEMFETIV